MNVTALFALAATMAFSPRQTSGYKKELPDSLVRRAKIAESDAAATARRRVPKGVIQSVELEMEGGKLIYSFDVKTLGRKGIDEVHIDASNGKLIAFEHETPAMEKKEMAADAKAAKKKP